MSAGRARKHFAPTKLRKLSLPVEWRWLGPFRPGRDRRPRAASICRPGAQKSTQGLQKARQFLGRQTEPPKAARRPQSRRSIHLEQGFEATRLNTGTMTDLATLAAHLLANFRTVRIPASGRQEGHADWWTMVKARGAAHRAAYAYRDRLCQELVEHGCRCFLDRMEPAGGWRLHIFPVDDAALALLDRLTEGAFGPGDAVSLNARSLC